jgi:predicted phosphodiesterase
MRGLPSIQIRGPLALVHASPDTSWRAPAHTAESAELESVYSLLGQQVNVYGHIHLSFVRNTTKRIVANSGSVSLSYDGDTRASYLLLDESAPTIRRVEYDVEKEVKALSECGLPHAAWIQKMLSTATPQMP